MSAACEDTSRASVHPMPIGGICCSRLHPAGYGNGPSLLTLAVTKRSTADRRHPALRCRDQNKIADELSNEALDGAGWAGGLKLPDVRPSVVLFWKFCWVAAAAAAAAVRHSKHLPSWHHGLCCKMDLVSSPSSATLLRECRQHW